MPCEGKLFAGQDHLLSAVNCHVTPYRSRVGLARRLAQSLASTECVDDAAVGVGLAFAAIAAWRVMEMRCCSCVPMPMAQTMIIARTRVGFAPKTSVGGGHQHLARF